MYNLAMLRLGAADSEAGCSEAVALLKHIAERGPWASVLREGLDAHRVGDTDRALWAFLRAADMGFESAQSNAAWLLRQSYGGGGARSDAAQLAVAMHRLAAGQGNVDSLLELGDAYYCAWRMNACTCDMLCMQQMGGAWRAIWSARQTCTKRPRRRKMCRPCTIWGLCTSMVLA